MSRGERAGRGALCALLWAAAILWGSLAGQHWESFWAGETYAESEECRWLLEEQRQNCLEELAELWAAQRRGESGYLQQQRLEALEEALDPEGTNFRYQIHGEEGELVSDNLRGAALEEEAEGRAMYTCTVTTGPRGDILSEDGTVLYLEGRGEQGLAAAEGAPGVSYHGWFSDGETWYSYERELDDRVESEFFVMEYGVARGMAAEDGFSAGLERYEGARRAFPLLCALAALGLAGGLWTLVPLGREAWRRGGEAAAGLDRVPLDLLLLGLLCAAPLLLRLWDIGLSLGQDWWLPSLLLRFLTAALGAGLGLGALLSLLSRARRGQWGGEFLALRLLRWLWKGLKGLAAGVGRGVNALWETISLTRSGLLLFLGYCLLSLLSFNTTPGLWLLLQALALVLVVRWQSQWRRIQRGMEEMARGGEAAIETKGMFREFREHAGALNALSTSVNQAVEERMRSERFKTELITNVSHDLKTPLTSIINYVDLMKKEDIQDPRLREYLEVLDRKSQRLKKLTEDLVEASKASSGTLPVELEDLDLGELAQQALAEYQDRLAGQGLAVVAALPEAAVRVRADGRHLWRVLDNLLGNCAKYAQPGTRVYLTVEPCPEGGRLSLKNISREPLNIPPEELTRRFVRGDQARSTEGSGLGLSIARSLAELQGGSLRLAIDGDLFKAEVVLPPAGPCGGGADGV